MKLIAKVLAEFGAWWQQMLLTAVELEAQRQHALDQIRAGRREAAADLENRRPEMLKRLRRYPQEIYSEPPQQPWRVCIDTEEQFELLLKQLRAETVKPEEALNRSLIL